MANAAKPANPRPRGFSVSNETSRARARPTKAAAKQSISTTPGTLRSRTLAKTTMSKGNMKRIRIARLTGMYTRALSRDPAPMA
jgi:hypothetical protein